MKYVVATSSNVASFCTLAFELGMSQIAISNDFSKMRSRLERRSGKGLHGEIHGFRILIKDDICRLTRYLRLEGRQPLELRHNMSLVVIDTQCMYGTRSLLAGAQPSS